MEEARPPPLGDRAIGAIAKVLVKARKGSFGEFNLFFGVLSLIACDPPLHAGGLGWSWDGFGAILGLLGAILGHLGAILGPRVF